MNTSTLTTPCLPMTHTAQLPCTPHDGVAGASAMPLSSRFSVNISHLAALFIPSLPRFFPLHSSRIFHV